MRSRKLTLPPNLGFQGSDGGPFRNSPQPGFDSYGWQAILLINRVNYRNQSDSLDCEGLVNRSLLSDEALCEVGWRRFMSAFLSDVALCEVGSSPSSLIWVFR
jgi:hypothetical protein